MEQGSCVCCGNSVSYSCNIFSGDITNLDISWETWHLCRPHYSERRKFGLVEFASKHPKAIIELHEKGYKDIAERAKHNSQIEHEARFV